MLRYYGPVEMSLTRWVRQDTELGGQRLRRGEQIVALLASANHDDKQFPNPESILISRGSRTVTSRSAPVSIPVWAPRWRVWKDRSRSPRCCRACQISRSPYPATRCAGATPRSCAA